MYTKTKKLIKFVLRMPKEETSFFYFTLESNENIAFYSTLDFEKGQAYRDIIVFTTPELLEYLNRILDHLSKTLRIETLSIQEISD